MKWALGILLLVLVVLAHTGVSAEQKCLDNGGTPEECSLVLM